MNAIFLTKSEKTVLGFAVTSTAVVVVVVIVVVKTQRQELKCSRLALGYFTLIGDKAPPAARDSSEVARS